MTDQEIIDSLRSVYNDQSEKDIKLMQAISLLRLGMDKLHDRLSMLETEVKNLRARLMFLGDPLA